MPFKPSDAKKHKKGLNSTQAKKWSKIANGVLNDCIKKGGTDKTCAPKAIRIANSKFTWPKYKQSEGIMEEQKLPKGALRFVEEGCHALVSFAEMEEEDGKKKKKPLLKMVAYSGGVIKDHWYWDNLAIDLDGIKFTQKKYPVLEEHMTSRKIAVIDKPVIEDGKLKAPENARFMNTDAANEFIDNSEKGFPFQSSIYAKPSNIERLEEGATAKVNGFTMKGPGTIWRACEFKEMSVCVFGWDSKTQSTAFSKSEFEECEFAETTTEAKGDGQTKKLVRRKGVSKSMDINELKEKHPDLYKQIVDDAVKASEQKFADEKASFRAEVDALKSQNDTLSETVLKLEKKDEIRSQKELAAKADNIWLAKLSASEVPENLYNKVKRHVSHTKFIDENGKFDVEAFNKAIDDEIASWIDLGVTDQVMGAGFSEKEVDDDPNKEKLAEDKIGINRLLKLAGQKVEDEK